jgi:hypothetical protein
LDEIGDVEQMVANFPEDEKKKFEMECGKRVENKEWCGKHGVNFHSPDYGVVIREIFDELYVIGENQRR